MVALPRYHKNLSRRRLATEPFRRGQSPEKLNLRLCRFDRQRSDVVCESGTSSRYVACDDLNEINALADTMEPELLDAIHGVRKVGNIGAHVKADINVIMDVDPDEAKLPHRTGRVEYSTVAR